MNNRQVLAIDIGGSKMMTALIASDGRVTGKAAAPLALPLTDKDIIKTAAGLARISLKSADGEMSAVGATIPGLADPASGKWVYSGFSGISNFPVADCLSREFGLPVFIENDVNACALGEIMFGACGGVKDFLWVTVSNGIGGCVIIDGKVHSGAFNGAGEIGHINVVEDGYKCHCGNCGCAEAHAAGPAVLRRYREANGIVPDGCSAKTIAEAAKKGDETAKKVYADTGYYLGKAIAAAVNIINPQKVILGGGVSMDFELLYPQLMVALNKFMFRQANASLKVEKTALGYDAALYGAAAIALNN